MAMVVVGGGKDRSSPGGGGAPQVDTGKYVRYTPEQVEALERVYSECPKPSSLRRQQLIRECPILSNIEPKQIKVWFQNRRCVRRRNHEPLPSLRPSSPLCSCLCLFVDELCAPAAEISLFLSPSFFSLNCCFLRLGYKFIIIKGTSFLVSRIFVGVRMLVSM
jgi:hypothetical protein